MHPKRLSGVQKTESRGSESKPNQLKSGMTNKTISKGLTNYSQIHLRLTLTEEVGTDI